MKIPYHQELGMYNNNSTKKICSNKVAHTAHPHTQVHGRWCTTQSSSFNATAVPSSSITINHMTDGIAIIVAVLYLFGKKKRKILLQLSSRV